MIPLGDLIARYAKAGSIETIITRPAKHAAVQAVTSAEISTSGIVGDHARPGKRAITLIQFEHLSVIASILGRGDVDPALLRRNLVVSGLNLAGLRGRAIRLGEACVEITGPCAPCSRMEAALGHGGYAALRGHGGWCARVLTPGAVRCNDTVRPDPPLPAP